MDLSIFPIGRIKDGEKVIRDLDDQKRIANMERP